MLSAALGPKRCLLGSVTLPIPPKSTHRNSRSRGFYKRAEGTSIQRGDAYFAARIAFPTVTKQASYLEILYKLHRRNDPDNLAGWLKASIDGFADYGIIGNDSWVECSPPQQVHIPEGERPCVEIQFWHQSFED